MPKTDRAEFECIIPDTATAIQVHGGGGCRIRFDVDNTNMAEALKLVMWLDKPLRVIVEPLVDSRDARNRAEPRY